MDYISLQVCLGSPWSTWRRSLRSTLLSSWPWPHWSSSLTQFEVETRLVHSLKVQKFSSRCIVGILICIHWPLWQMVTENVCDWWRLTRFSVSLHVSCCGRINVWPPADMWCLDTVNFSDRIKSHRADWHPLTAVETLEIRGATFVNHLVWCDVMAHYDKLSFRFSISSGDQRTALAVWAFSLTSW